MHNVRQNSSVSLAVPAMGPGGGSVFLSSFEGSVGFLGVAFKSLEACRTRPSVPVAEVGKGGAAPENSHRGGSLRGRCGPEEDLETMLLAVKWL